MSFRDRMKKTGADKRLKRRYDKGTNKVEYKGKFQSVLDKSKIPAGIENWWCKEGDHVVDIIPWYAGPDFPLNSKMEPMAEEGEMVGNLQLLVHRNMGSMQKQYVCPFENFGLECPVCEYIKAHKLDKENWKELSTKHRVFYLVWVHDNREEEKKGVQLWEVAGFFMEEKLEVISDNPKEGGSIDYWHPDHGKSVAWTRRGTKNTEYLGHRFIDRDGLIPERILDQGFPIDGVINMHPTYEEIEKDLFGTLKRLKLDTGNGEEEEESSPYDKEDIPDDSFDPDEGASRKRTTARKRTRPQRQPAPTGGKKRKVRRKKR